MAEEVLRGLVTGDEKISGVLREVEGGLQDLAGAARFAGEEMEELAGAFTVAGQSADELGDEVSALAGVAAIGEEVTDELGDATQEMGTTMAAVTPAVELYESGLSELPGEMFEATVAAEGTSSAIDETGEEAGESAVQVGALGAAIGALPREKDVDVDVDTGTSGLAGIADTLTDVQESLSGVVGAGLEGITGGADDATESLDGLQSSLAALPEGARIDVSAADADALSSSLQEAGDEARDAADAVRRVGAVEIDGETIEVDALVEGAEGVADLQAQLDAAGGEATEASRRLDRLGATSEDLFDDAIQGASGMEALAENVDEMGTAAAAAAAEVGLLEESTGELVGEAATSSATVAVLSERVDELGDEAGGSALEVLGLSGAISSLGAASGVSAHIGGISGSIGTIAKLAAPAAAGLASLAAVAGGLSVSGLGALGGLGGLLAGGAMGLGEDIAARSPFDDIKTSAEGLEALFKDIKSTASTILDPLKSEASQDLFLGAISAGLGVLEDSVTLVKNLEGELTGFASAIGETWAAVSPEVFSELESTISEFLPAIQAMVTGALEALPGLLAAFREHGAQLVPMLMDAGSAFIELLPALTRLGTMGLSVAIPMLTALLHVLDGLWPIIDTLAPMVYALGSSLAAAVDAAEPFLEVLGAVLATGLVVGKGVAVASAALSGLSAVAGALTGVLSGGLLASLASVAGTLLSLVNPITAAAAVTAGLLTYFDLWDDLAAALAGTFNFLVEGLEFFLNLGMIASNVLISLLTPFSDFNEMVTAIGDTLDWAGKKVQELGRLAQKWLGPVAGAVGEVAQMLNKETDKAGGVDLSGAKIEQGGASGSGGGGGPAGPGPNMQSGSMQKLKGPSQMQQGGRGSYAGQSAKTQYREGDINIQNIDASGEDSASDVERAVQRGVEQALRERRRRTSPSN